MTRDNDYFRWHTIHNSILTNCILAIQLVLTLSTAFQTDRILFLLYTGPSLFYKQPLFNLNHFLTFPIYSFLPTSFSTMLNSC